MTDKRLMKGTIKLRRISCFKLMTYIKIELTENTLKFNDNFLEIRRNDCIIFKTGI